MKWKCLICHGVFDAESDGRSRCSWCGSVATMAGDVERNEPVLVLISGDLPLELDRVPFRDGQVVKLGRVRPQGSVFTAAMFSDYIRSMRNW